MVKSYNENIEKNKISLSTLFHIGVLCSKTSDGLIRVKKYFFQKFFCISVIFLIHIMGICCGPFDFFVLEDSTMIWDTQLIMISFYFLVTTTTTTEPTTAVSSFTSSSSSPSRSSVCTLPKHFGTCLTDSIRFYHDPLSNR